MSENPPSSKKRSDYPLAGSVVAAMAVALLLYALSVGPVLLFYNVETIVYKTRGTGLIYRTDKGIPMLDDGLYKVHQPLMHLTAQSAATRALVRAYLRSWGIPVVRYRDYSGSGSSTEMP